MIRFLITLFLLLTAVAANYGFPGSETEIPRRNLTDFPEEIDGWKMVGAHTIDEKLMEMLLVDDYIMRTYMNRNGEAIALYVGYFKTQREGKQVHSPRQCLPGSGWDIIEESEAVVSLKTHNPEKYAINLFVMEKGADRDLFLWWYQGRGRICASEYLNKFYLIWDALTKNRTDGALVRVNSRVNSDVGQALKIQTDFLNSVLPELKAYIPE